MTSLFLHRVCGFVINYTDSLPRGIYQLRPIKKEIERNMIVALAVPEHVQSLVYGRKWLFKGTMLMKPVAAIPGDKILISENGLYINERYFGPVFSFDSDGLPLPEIRISYTLRDRQVFLASRYKKSFESRYFGHVYIKNIIAEALPILTFKGRT